MSIRGSIIGQATLRTAVGISSRPRAVFLAFRIALQVSAAIIGEKAILQVAAVGELKGISPISAEFVKRLRIRIPRFLLMSAAKPAFGFSRSLNRGLQYALVDLCYLVI